MVETIFEKSLKNDIKLYGQEKNIKNFKSPLLNKLENNTNNEILEGDIIFKKIVNILTTMKNGFYLYDEQIHTLRSALASCIPRIYIKDFEKKKNQILKSHKLNKEYPICCIIAARQHGKTTLIVLLVISLCLSIPALLTANFIVRIYAMNLNQAKSFVSECGVKLKSIHEKYKKDFEIKITVQSIIFKNKKNKNDIRCIYVTCSRAGVKKKLKKIKKKKN